MMDEAQLPEAFGGLKPFIGWALQSETARSERRRTSTLKELQAFYEAMLPRVPDALSYLDRFPLDEMPARESRLLELTLAFAEVAPFVEQYGRVVLPVNFDERRFVPIHDVSAGKPT